MPAIELSRVNKAFGPKVAVRDLDLAVEPGSLVGFIGRNGAGKTTTIRVIMSIIFPDSGVVRVLGRPSAVESKDRIGYLPEERGVYKKMKVAPFLAYMARLKGVGAAGLDAKIDAWLERVELADVRRKKLQELSKGMQQKVQFVAAIIHEPDLLILDEPFSGLDPVNSRLLLALINEQHAKGRTVVFSTHQMSQAEAICDRVVMIDNGRKVLDNTLAEIRRRFEARAILVEPIDPAPDVSALRAMPAVEGVTEENGCLRIRLRDTVAAASMLPAVATAIPARRIELVRPTLEDVFISIVQGSHATDEERRALRDALQSGDQAFDSAPRSGADRGGD